MIDEIVIRRHHQQYWLYTAADQLTNELVQIWLITTMLTAQTEISLKELRQKHDVEDPVILVEDTYHLQATLRQQGWDLKSKATEIGILSNIYFARNKDEPFCFQTVLVTST